jgi:hypothetical protein
MRAPKLLLVGLCALPFVLAACGDDDDGSSEDEDQITAALDRAATSGDPAACTEVQTQKFIEQTGGGETGQAAIKSCQKDAADTPAEEVEVTDVEVDGDAATAKAAVTGSFFDGQTLNLALVKEGDQWKLDELTSFDDFDRDAMVAAISEELASEEGASPQAVDCVAGQIQSLPEDQVQAAFLGDSDAEDALFAPCEKFFGEG